MESSPDRYEERYMRGNDALIRSRARMRGWTHALFAVLTAFVVFTLVRTHGWHAGAALVLLVTTVGLWAANLIVRATVTRRYLDIQHGLFGPKIPLDQIEDVQLTSTGLLIWLKCVGWGLGGRGIDGAHCYIVPGGRQALAIRYRDESGRSRRALVSSDEPELLLAAIRPTELSAASIQVRVDAGVPLESRERGESEPELTLAAVDHANNTAEIQKSKRAVR